MLYYYIISPFKINTFFLKIYAKLFNMRCHCASSCTMYMSTFLNKSGKFQMIPSGRQLQGRYATSFLILKVFLNALIMKMKATKHANSSSVNLNNSILQYRLYEFNIKLRKMGAGIC